MKLKNESERIMLFGSSNSGKTWYLSHTLIPQVKTGIIIIDSLDEYKIKGFITTEDIYSCIKLVKTLKKPKIIFRVSTESLNNFFLLCRLVSLMENITLIVDEITYYKDKENDYLSDIVRRGRHKNQSLIIATQNPVDVPPIYRNNITAIYFFQLLEKRYIDFCKSIIGDKADKLSQLEQGQFIKYPDCLK